MTRIRKIYNKIITQKLQGYALAFAVFIFAIVIILSSTLVLSAYYNNYFFNRIVLSVQMTDNASSAINLLLVHPDMVDYSSAKTISLYGEYADSVKVEKEQWGVFDLVVVTAFHKNLQVKRSAIIGNYKYDSTHVALFVPDQGKPISVTGDVRIKGNCLLPESGFKQAHIEGKNFTGSKIDKGNIQKSSHTLPDLNENIANLSVDFFINKYINNSNKIIAFEELRQDSLISSFQDSVTILYSPSSIELNDLFLQGKIIVLSEQKIQIGNNTQLNDIICVAPYILVENQFTGKLQLFAGDSIHIENNCYFKYPSVAGITIPRADNKSTRINIDEKTVLNGMAFIYQKAVTLDKQPSLRLGKESIIKGQVYCNGHTEVKGNIYGALYTARFMLSTPSAIYENTLMDTNIDMFKLSRNYVGADLIQEQTQGSIVKWVY